MSERLEIVERKETKGTYSEEGGKEAERKFDK